MVLTLHDQRRAQPYSQTHDPLSLGRGRSRALGIRRRDLFTRPRRHRTGPFVWPCSLPAQQQEHPMPPQQTNITPETERNAAGLGLGLPIALAKDAMVEALAAQRLN